MWHVPGVLRFCGSGTSKRDKETVPESLTDPGSLEGS